MKLFCVLDKSGEDKEDVTVWHGRAENEEEIRLEIANRHYSIGDVDETRKYIDLDTGEVKEDLKDEFEEEYGWSPELDFSDYEITEVDI
jgi:hypothetical protein